MTFYKYQGAGNDFLIADNRDGSVALLERQIATLCDRRYGVGADGLMLLDAAEKHLSDTSCCTDGFRMTYYNSDGSGGMMCGNGIRCVAKYAYDRGIAKKQTMTVETKSGIKTLEITDKDGKVVDVKISYPANYIEQHLKYGKEYSFLPTLN